MSIRERMQVKKNERKGIKQIKEYVILYYGSQANIDFN